MQQKIQKMFFGFEIIALELITSDPRFYWEIILFIGCQYVNKHSQDLRHY